MDFYRSFQREKDQIRNDIGTRSASELMNLICSLQERCYAQRSRLSRHDLQSFEKELSDLTDLVRRRPRRFEFRRKLEVKHSEIPNAEPAAPKATDLENKDCIYGQIVKPRSNATCCILYEPERVRHLHLTDVSKSIVLVPHLDGPAHLTNITDTIIIARCNQFRMHASHDVTVHTTCKCPVIEESTNIRFGTCEGAAVDRVDDFDFPLLIQSPNWSFIEKDESFAWSTDEKELCKKLNSLLKK